MRKHTRALPALGLMLMGLFLAACASAPPAPTIRGPEPTGPAAQMRQITEYRLGSGDAIRLSVFNEPELTGEYQVNGAGFVSVPLIGEVQAAGRTVREFQRAVEDALKSGYLREPRVSAEVLNFRPYYILGEVVKPGEYPYTEGLTVMNAIATAEGFSYRANQRVIVIKGARDLTETRIELSPSTPVQPGDTIRVLERFF